MNHVVSNLTLALKYTAAEAESAFIELADRIAREEDGHNVMCTDAALAILQAANKTPDDLDHEVRRFSRIQELEQDILSHEQDLEELEKQKPNREELEALEKKERETREARERLATEMQNCVNRRLHLNHLIQNCRRERSELEPPVPADEGDEEGHV